MRLRLHGDLRRLGTEVEVSAQTPKEALGLLGLYPESDTWILSQGGRIVDLEQPLAKEAVLEVWPPIAGGEHGGEA